MAEMHVWNWLDWALALIVLFSVVSGVGEGFTRGLIGLASLVVGLAVAAGGYRGLGGGLSTVIHSHDLAYGVAFLILFIAVVLIGAIISHLAEKLLKTAGIRSFDRLLGLFFGLLRGILFDAIVLMALLAFGIQSQAVRASRLAPSVMQGSRAMAALMPADLRAEFDAGLEKLKGGLVKTEERGKENASPAR
ncbi:MAG TPA: CvpA family protein [Terriglobia bacterium]